MSGKKQQYCRNGHDKHKVGEGYRGECKKCRSEAQKEWRAKNGRTDKGSSRVHRATTGTQRTRAIHEPPSTKSAAPRAADMTSGDLYGDNFHLRHLSQPKNLAEADQARDRSDRLQEQREERARLRKRGLTQNAGSE